MQQAKNICVDFDGVINSYRSGWAGATTIADEPMVDLNGRNAIDWLTELARQPDLRVHIYSSRSAAPGGIEAMKAWLAAYGMAADTLTRITFPTKKPAAWLTIDDRAERFEGRFMSPMAIREFEPWKP